jgi:CarD family transcriptional regulator
MNFQVGDKVIHWAHGLGEITGLDEKVLSGRKMRYYVVKAKDSTVWVPADESDVRSLRLPMPENDFGKLIAVLRGTCEVLPTDRQERKARLVSLLKEGNSGAICRLVRDLSFYRRTKKLNDNELAILKSASDSLLNEWMFSLSVSLDQAERDLRKLLEERAGEAKA